MKKITLLILLSAFSCLSCGSAAAKVFYLNLDSVIIYELKSWFDITESQQKSVSGKCALHLLWHRREVLPVYEEILSSARAEMIHGFSPQSYLRLQNSIGSESARLADRVADDAADFLLDLSPSQIDHFALRCREYNSSLEKKISDAGRNPDEVKFDNAAVFLEKWYGSFDKNQKMKLRPLILSIPEIQNDVLRLQYLRQTQDGFIALLRGRRDRTQIRSYVRGWICRDRNFVPPWYRSVLESQKSAAAQLVAAADHSVITGSQREEGADRLQGYIDVIENIRRQK